VNYDRLQLSFQLGRGSNCEDGQKHSEGVMGE